MNISKTIFFDIRNKITIYYDTYISSIFATSNVIFDADATNEQIIKEA